MAARLPVSGSDDGTWGTILNTYLLVSHASDGTLNANTVGTSQLSDSSVTSAKIADATITTGDIATNAGILKTQLESGVQTSLGKADSALQTVPDATASTKGAVQLAGDLGGTAASPTVPTKISIAQRPVNVLEMPNSLTSAVGDGTFHQLSERFATLAAAQAAFPRATALTESIDRHALQYALDNYDVVDYGHKSLIIDAPVYTSDPTTTRGLGYQKLYGTGWLVHDSVATSAHAILRSGNSRNIANDATPTSTEAPECPYLDITVKVDGNKAALGGDKAAIYMVGVSYSTFNVIVKNPQGCGLQLNGTSDGYYTNGISLEHVEVYGSTSAYAMRVSLRCRKTSYLDIHVHDNNGVGLYLDSSEATLGLIRATNNGSSGVFIHNVFTVVGGIIHATENGTYGVHMSGVTSSSIDMIAASNNGTLNDTSNYADLYWDAAAASYGVSYSTTVRQAILGPTNNFGSAGLELWAMYFEDGVNTDIDVDVRYLAPGTSGYSRMPATLGTLRVRETKPGSSDIVYPATGAPVLSKLSDVTISTTPTDGQVLKYSGVSNTWTPGTDNTSGTGSSSPYTIASGAWWQSATGATGSMALTLSKMLLIPVEFPAAQTFQGFALYVNTVAAGSVVRAGLYPADANGLPNLAGLIADFGTIDSSTATGTQTITGLSVAAPAGRAWVAVVAQGGTPSVQTTSSGSGLTFPLPTSINPPAASNAYQMLGVANVTGALPTSGTLVTGPGTCVKVFLQAA